MSMFGRFIGSLAQVSRKVIITESWVASSRTQSSLLDKSLVPHSGEFCQVRHRGARTYRPNAEKRIRKTGWNKRIATKNGLEILWRRVLKGRYWLTTTNRKDL